MSSFVAPLCIVVVVHGTLQTVHRTWFECIRTRFVLRFSVHFLSCCTYSPAPIHPSKKSRTLVIPTAAQYDRGYQHTRIAVHCVSSTLHVPYNTIIRLAPPKPRGPRTVRFPNSLFMNPLVCLSPKRVTLRQLPVLSQKSMLAPTPPPIAPLASMNGLSTVPTARIATASSTPYILSN